MNLPNPPEQYDRQDQLNVRQALREADDKKLKRGVEISAEPITRTSPDGTKWVFGVSNAGTTVWTVAP